MDRPACQVLNLDGVGYLRPWFHALGCRDVDAQSLIGQRGDGVTAVLGAWVGIETEDEARDLGLINRVCDDEQLMTDCMSMAAAIAEKSPLTLKLLKRTIMDGLDMALPASLRHEQAMIGLVLDSEDAHEGCAAFLDRRTAKFEGR